MREALEKFNAALKPYYALLTMMVFFGTLLLVSYNYIVSPTDLHVTVTTDRMNYPASIGKSYDEIYRAIKAQDALSSEALNVYRFLVNTTECKRIVLRNVGASSLKDVKFRYINADDLTGWSISSDFLTSDEEETLKRNLMYDDRAGVVYIKNSLNIPTKSQVNIVLWGSFKEDLFERDVVASYDAGDASFEKQYLLTGLKGYLVNYALEFILVMLLLFAGVYHVGVKFAREKS
jgi:hypothetical protein